MIGYLNVQFVSRVMLRAQVKQIKTLSFLFDTLINLFTSIYICFYNMPDSLLRIITEAKEAIR